MNPPGFGRKAGLSGVYQSQMIPTFTPSISSINIPDAPNSSNIPLPGDAPDAPNLTFPDSPDIVLPDRGVGREPL